MKRIISIVFLLSIITLIIATSGCVNKKDDKSNQGKYNEEKIELEYTIIIESNNNSNYIVYIPLIVYGNWVEMRHEHKFDGEVLNINNDFVLIEGFGKITIISTEYGNAFKIEANSTIKIKINSDDIEQINPDGGNPDVRLSLINDSDNDSRKDDEYHNSKYWVYYQPIIKNDTIDIDINLEIYYSKNSFDGKIYLNATLYNGWQLVNGTKVADAG